MITTVTKNHQVSIPADLARALSIKAGTRLEWTQDETGALRAMPLPDMDGVMEPEQKPADFDELLEETRGIWAPTDVETKRQKILQAIAEVEGSATANLDFTTDDILHMTRGEN